MKPEPTPLLLTDAVPYPVRSDHFHCPACHGNGFYFLGGERVCSGCNATPPPVMLVCTPAICGSS